MEEIKVLVPAERVTEFYRWFADWSDGVAAPPQSPPVQPTAAEVDPLAAGVTWWKSLKRRERAVWSLWIDAAPRLVPASEIAERLQLNDTRVIPGVLSWSTRKGAKAGFRVTWTYSEDPVTDKPVYGIEDTEYAALLRQVRAGAEGPSTHEAAR